MAWLEGNGGRGISGLEKVWTGTAREYATNSTISIDLSKYDKYLIKFLSCGSNESSYSFYQLFDISNGSQQITVMGMAYNLDNVTMNNLRSYRNVTVASTGLTLGEPIRYYDTSAANIANSYIIPIEIYGVAEGGV